MPGDTLARARAAFEQEHWTEALDLLRAADSVAPLDAEDLDRLAAAAHLAGADEINVDARTRAHEQYLDRGDLRGAARSAFWLGFSLVDRPRQQALAGGWLTRARRLLEGSDEACVEHGFLLCAQAYHHMVRAEVPAAMQAFAEAGRLGLRFRDRDLMALARHGEGRCLLRAGRRAEGLALLDEVMAGVSGGGVGPLVTGLVYCSLISACHELFDLQRAREWTGVLAAWCDRHPDIVPFRGACLVRRGALLRLQGEWDAARTELTLACAHLDRPGLRHEIGQSLYELAEMQRLRGEFAAAEASYREAARAGLSPQPGLALLRLARGDVDAAVAAIGLALDETRRQPARVHTLRAAVDILLAGGRTDAARAAADELGAIAADLGTPYVVAAAAAADGAVLIREGDIRHGIARLREACAIWHDLEARYEIGRASEALGTAYDMTGDAEGAALQFDTASSIFEALGAGPDLARLSSRPAPPAPSGTPLTGRELEVLRLLATGRTNRSIAADLAISEKTVARHISNIFNKLDLSSRTAATAYAYRHHLV